MFNRLGCGNGLVYYYSNKQNNNIQQDALDILNKKFVNGEISEED
ncbi:MAG: hypothetical protein K0Q49_2260 [Haloplasmataceae bacterium]|jgi:uncharacterized membrane protein|nr:hypothetical protein [Haloplasmataceae bacterium]